MDEPSGLRKNKQWGKENIKCSYCARGFHPKISCMKRKIDKMALLLEKNNITLLECARNTDTIDRNNKLERGNALMDNVSKDKSHLIDSGASNHMVACKDSFASLDSDSWISIHMGDDFQVSFEGKGTIHLEHGSFKNVLHVPSLDSNL